MECQIVEKNTSSSVNLDVDFQKKSENINKEVLTDSKDSKLQNENVQVIIESQKQIKCESINSKEQFKFKNKDINTEDNILQSSVKFEEQKETELKITKEKEYKHQNSITIINNSDIGEVITTLPEDQVQNNNEKIEHQDTSENEKIINNIKILTEVSEKYNVQNAMQSDDKNQHFTENISKPEDLTKEESINKEINITIIKESKTDINQIENLNKKEIHAEENIRPISFIKTNCHFNNEFSLEIENRDNTENLGNNQINEIKLHNGKHNSIPLTTTDINFNNEITIHEQKLDDNYTLEIKEDDITDTSSLLVMVQKLQKEVQAMSFD